MAKKHRVAVPAVQVAHLKPYEDVFRDRLAELPLEKLLIYLIDTVDAKALPYLAEQFNVLGNRGWRWATTESKQRALLKKAIYLHRIEGTEAAITEALQIIGIENAEVLHPIPGNYYNGQFSHNGTITYGGAYHWACFKVLVDYLDLVALPSDTLDIAVELINEWKNVRSKLIGVEVSANLEDFILVSDGVEIEATYDFNEKLGPNNYDGVITYDGTATHSGEYDKFEVGLEADLFRSFVVYVNAEPLNSTMDATVEVSGTTLWTITWPDGSNIGYTTSDEFGVANYAVPLQDVDDLVTFAVEDQDLINTITIFSPVAAGFEISDALTNLTQLVMSDCAVEIFTLNNGSESIPALAELRLDGNKLSTDSVNDILVLVAGNGVADGFIDLSGQTPTAPPTGAGITAKASLEANGWTVVTD